MVVVGEVIDYTRGYVTVLDRGELESRSCECHEVIGKEYDRLLGPQG